MTELQTEISSPDVCPGKTLLLEFIFFQKLFPSLKTVCGDEDKGSLKKISLNLLKIMVQSILKFLRWFNSKMK